MGCEACHGPGSLHVEWAKAPPMARLPVENFALPVKTSGLANRDLVNLCGPSCHARRSGLRDQDRPGGEPLDVVLPVLLTPGLFFPDGQILDEDLRVPLVPPEQDVCERSEVQRLPRRPRGQAPQGRQRPVRPLPPGGHLRHGHAPLPQEGLQGEAQRGGVLCCVPHARANLHGGALPAGPQPAGASPGSLRPARDAQCLRLVRLSRRQTAAVGRGGVQQVVRRQAKAPLRDSPGRRPGAEARGQGRSAGSWPPTACGPPSSAPRPSISSGSTPARRARACSSRP